MREAELSNQYDYNKMLKDFESEERHINSIRKAKNKWKNENKQYLIRLEQMKEKKEENYKNRRNNALKEYLKKQKDIERQLYKTRISKESDRKKTLQLMLKKGEEAKEKQRKKLERDEQQRINIESQIFSRSKNKLYKYIINL